MIPRDDDECSLQELAKDDIYRTQAFVQDLVERIAAIDQRVRQLENELEPQLIELTRLLKRITEKEMLN
jgi:hypothetical protein